MPLLSICTCWPSTFMTAVGSSILICTATLSFVKMRITANKVVNSTPATVPTAGQDHFDFVVAGRFTDFFKLGCCVSTSASGNTGRFSKVGCGTAGTVAVGGTVGAALGTGSNPATEPFLTYSVRSAA